MANGFGNTWWGSRWLLSLTHIDYENRIPRGATYARAGAVREIKVKGNVISAKVEGRRPRPYSVTIIVPPFFPEDVERLIQGIMERPDIVSKLLKHELDPAVMDIASECGLKIFPEKWTDFKMQCSCPDWAVPCKHLAAVIYMMSREIDNNPFLVFTIHNVDLLEELKKRGVTVDEAAKTAAVPSVKDVVEFRKPAKEVGKEAPEFHRVNFSRLSDRLDVLLMLLPPNPAFDLNGDFKERYSSQMRKISGNAVKFFEGKLPAERLFPPQALSNEYNEYALSGDSAVSLEADLLLDWNMLYSPDGKEFTKADENAVLREIAGINPDFIPDYSPSVTAVHQGFLASMHLMANGDIAPQIVRLADGNCAVRWIPCTVDPEVTSLLESLEAIIPDTMIRFKVGKSGKYVKNKAGTLLSYLLGKLVPELSLASHRPLTGIFFDGERYAFDQPGEREIPGSIAAWLSSYSIRQSRFVPVLTVDENVDGMFYVNLGVEDVEAPEKWITALSDVLAKEEFASSRLPILKAFTDLSVIIPEVGRYIARKAARALRYSLDEFVPLLMRIIPAIKLLGVKVFLPKSLENLIRPKPTLKLKKKTGGSPSCFRLSDLFEFEWEVALGDEVVSAEDFHRLLGQAGKLLKFKGQYIYTSPEDLEKVNKAIAGVGNVSPGEMLQAAILGEYDSAPIVLSDEAKELIEEFTNEEEIPVPDGVKAELRPYQKRGYSWLYRNMRVGFGSILADDMGLGKTLQTITLLQKMKDEGVLREKPALVVVPTGLLSNWQAEISRFAPGLTSFIYHGTGRQGPESRVDILLTTYGVLRSDQKIFAKVKWSVMVIDEAQNIKNPTAIQSKAVRSITADTKIALSGTPVENRLTEFWSIMDYANSGYLGNLKSFKSEYANPIQLYNDEECAARFRKVTAPFMMRRMKTDMTVISDLPDKVEINEYSALSPEQAALYHKTLDAAMAEIEGKDTSDSAALFERQGLILQMILALKQICNHPAQYLKNGNMSPSLSGKVEMLLDRLDGIVDAGEKVLVFTQYHKTLDAAMAEIEGKDTSDSAALFERQGLILQMILALKQICNHPAQYLKNGNMSPSLSGKVEMLLDRLDGIVDAGEKVLVFTQFKEMGEMLVKFVGDRTGKAPMFYHGGCSVKQRNEMVSRFQNGREDKIFILSLKAAGTGLNLTAASHVIHFDLWWNPAVEAQATDRAYRIGQNKNVMVHRFITKDTFEGKIDAMIQRKKHLAEMTVSTGESWIGKLSNKELHDIFG